MTARDVAVEIDNLSFAYEGAMPSIHSVNLRVSRGQCHVLMGGSGSGKTTIIRCINGLAGGYYAGTVSGVLRIGGTDAQSLTSWERAKKIGSVFQDPASQFFSAQLAGEIAFGLENIGYDHEQVCRRTDSMISRLSLDYLRAQNIDTLSSGEKQKVAVASALAPRPAILVMDEPSANLDEEASIELGNTLKELKNQGYTLVIAEHRISYLMDVADCFHYVADGTITNTFTRDDVYKLSDERRIDMGIRSPRYVERDLSVRSALGSETDGCLDVHDMTVRIEKKDIVSQASLSLQSGTITAIVGENGAGKTTFMRAIAGLVTTREGRVVVEGRSLGKKERRKKIWYSPNDLSAQFFTASVAEEIMLQVPHTDSNVERARTLLQTLDLYNHKNSHPYALSGGQKQRLALACGLMQRRRVLIFDEPTSGLDAINMERLAAALRTAAEEGAAIAVITHDNEFINSCATHLYSMKSLRSTIIKEEI